MFTRRYFLLLISIIVSSCVFMGGCNTVKTEIDNKQEFKIYPIGKVIRQDGKTMIALDKQYSKGLLGLDKQKHIHVLYWFDKNDTPAKRAVLQVHPRGNKENPLTGVFGTHSPFRPNLIAVSRCKIIAIKDNIIEIDQIDAFDNSPIIDIKGDFFYYYKAD